MEKDAGLLSLEEGFIIYDFILITLFTFVAGKKTWQGSLLSSYSERMQLGRRHFPL